MKKMMTISCLFFIAFTTKNLTAQTNSSSLTHNSQLNTEQYVKTVKTTVDYYTQTDVETTTPKLESPKSKTFSSPKDGLNSKKRKSKQPKHRIIMQLTSSDTLAHKSTIKQINNLKEGWGQDVEIELVCHGPGLNILRKSTSKFEKQLNQLKEKGVIIYACENTLKERNIPREDIFGQFDFVKMGIGEVVEKQEQGWSYIKAGF